jgi:mannose-1-phosphate guanylyltransferase
MTPLTHFWAVIPAGGAGTRLWPLSRAGEPKFLHDLTGSGRSLLQTTRDRLAPLVDDRVLVVTGVAHRPAVVEQLSELDPARIIAEPAPRDSMAAIGLAAALLELEDPDAVMGSFAADHVVTDPDAFLDCVRLAEAVARDGWLVTIGIEPSYPATGFGYIHTGAEMAEHPGAFVATQFVEKPVAEVAARYCAAGDYRWNAGIFVVRPGVLLDLLALTDPDFAAALRAIAAAPETLDAVWSTLPKIALDHAVAEPAADAGRVAVVPGSFGWDDIGDFASLHTLLRDETEGMTVLGDPRMVRSIDASGLVVAGTHRMVAIVGLDDVVVVDTGDAILVTTTDRAQDVKAIVEELKAGGHPHLT